MVQLKIVTNPVFIVAGAVILLLLIYTMASGALTPTVAVGDIINVSYTGSFTNGTVFDSSAIHGPFQFTVGSGQVIKGFDNAVVGMKLNENKTVTITPDEGYGQVNPQLIQKIPSNVFGNHTIVIGMGIIGSINGQQARGTVMALNGNMVTVNFNPPLAGRTLVFTIKVIAIQKKHS